MQYQQRKRDINYTENTVLTLRRKTKTKLGI